MNTNVYQVGDYVEYLGDYCLVITNHIPLCGMERGGASTSTGGTHTYNEVPATSLLLLNEFLNWYQFL